MPRFHMTCLGTPLIACLVLSSAAGAADPTWRFSGESYLRWDHRDGATGGSSNLDFADLDLPANAYLFARTTLGFSIQDEDRWEFAISGRDNRVWSDDRDLSPREDTLDLFTASLSFKASDWQVRLGRQEINWGSAVAIGASSYNNGQTFDAVTLQRPFGGIRFSAIGGWNVRRLPDAFNATEHGDRFAGLALDWNRERPQHVYVLQRDTSATLAGGARALTTAGWRTQGAWFAGLRYDLEGTLQIGNHDTATRSMDHRSWLLQGRLERSFSKLHGKPLVAIEVLYSPGDGDPTDDVVETWDLLYSGGNHRRAGLFDAISWRNQSSLAVHGSWKPAPAWTVQARLWRFALASSRDFFFAQGGASGRNANGYGRRPGWSTELGHELDLWATWEVRTNWSWTAELSAFDVGRYIKRSLATTTGSRNALYASLRSHYSF